MAKPSRITLNVQAPKMNKPGRGVQPATPSTDPLTKQQKAKAAAEQAALEQAFEQTVGRGPQPTTAKDFERHHGGSGE